MTTQQQFEQDLLHFLNTHPYIGDEQSIQFTDDCEQLPGTYTLISDGATDQEITITIQYNVIL